MKTTKSLKILGLWTFATAVGLAIGYIALNSINTLLMTQQIFSETGEMLVQRPAWLNGFYVFAPVGFCVGVFQWLVLILQGKKAPLWIPATVIGVGVGFTAGIPLADPLPSVALYRLGLFAFIGCCTGFFQWLTFRQFTMRSLWWMVISITGWCLFMKSLDISDSLLNSNQYLQILNFTFLLDEILGWFLGGTILGLFTGGMSRLLIPQSDELKPYHQPSLLRHPKQPKSLTSANYLEKDEGFAEENYHNWLGSDINNRR